MGYYTDYILEVTNNDPDAIAFLEEQQELGAFFGGMFDRECQMKWYEYDKDMAALSIKFPNAIFCLNGKGEESDDLWKAYFKNGQMQMCPAEVVITFPEMKKVWNDKTSKKIPPSDISQLIEDSKSKQEAIKASALSKLSAQEKKALGL